MGRDALAPKGWSGAGGLTRQNTVRGGSGAREPPCQPVHGLSMGLPWPKQALRYHRRHRTDGGSDVYLLTSVTAAPEPWMAEAWPCAWSR